MTLLYDFQILTDKLLALGAISSAAELQGMLCGQLAGGKEQNDDDWIVQARDFMDLGHFDITSDQEQVILYVLNESKQALVSDEYAFTPLLPDDACPLPDKARELGAWCRGFLHGFGASGVTKDTSLSAEVAEVIRDVAKISQATNAVDEQQDETENDWYELVEYLRAGVYTIYNEMNPVGEISANLSSDTKH